MAKKPIKKKSISINRPRSRDFETHIIIPDAHVPFENKGLHNAIRKFIRDCKPYGLWFPGDFLDLASLSSHVAGSLEMLRNITLSDEYKAGNKELDSYDDAANGVKKKGFLYGNHEFRYQRTIQQGDNGKYGESLESPTTALRLRERGYEVREDWQQEFFKIGKHLELIHHGSIAKNSSSVTLDEFQGSVMYGHSHRVNSFVTGKRGAYNIGCTCDIDSPAFFYMPRTKRMRWQSAFGIVNVDPDGEFHPQIIQVHNSSFIANGRVYRTAA